MKSCNVNVRNLMVSSSGQCHIFPPSFIQIRLFFMQSCSQIDKHTNQLTHKWTGGKNALLLMEANASIVRPTRVTGVSTDPGDHGPDTHLGGVQGDCSRTLGWGLMGVPQHPLQQWSDDAGRRRPLPHHHRHDSGTQVSWCVSVPYRWHSLWLWPRLLSLQINRIVAMKLCDIGLFTFIFIFQMDADELCCECLNISTKTSCVVQLSI